MIFDGFILQLIHGTKTTILVTVVSILIGIVVGLIGAICELSKIKMLRNTALWLSSVIRSIPELLVVFAIYFGGTILLNKLFAKHDGVNAFSAGVLALGIIYGAYATQVFRGAFLMLHKGQVEASYALGLSKISTYKSIILPQVFRYALPGLSNLCLVTLKDSSLVALIGLQELTFKAQIAANESYKPFTYYMLCAVIYLVLTLVFEVVFKLANNRKKYGF
ncbi:MAG: ABC transporter permease subunit [Burkholderiales bacterium]|nr:ABC transporter permease subunit [Burkholderiales bacterium]